MSPVAKMLLIKSGARVAVFNAPPSNVEILRRLPATLTRDRGWEIVTANGFEGVRLISIDETWPAMRFSQAGRAKR